MFGALSFCFATLLSTSLLTGLFMSEARAEDDIILVPFAPNNPDLPHPVHEGARVTLKGIVRNATCGNYRVIWDTDRDGNFETNGQDETRNVSPWNKTIYDISAYYEVPSVSGDQRWPVNVQIYNTCNGKETLATYRMFVYDWRPSNDVRNWTTEQIEVMGQTAIQEGLWHLHRRMTRSGTNAQMTGYPSSGGNTHAGAVLSVWAYAINGHLPAFPTGPGSNFKTNSVTPSQVWYERNNYRWEHDPYAETSARIVNHILARGTGWVGINSADESDECELTVLSNGTNRRSTCTPIPGTNNSKGAYSNGVSNNVYYQGVTLSGLASALPGLAGSQLQTGGLSHLSWEAFIQEMTDYMGYQQIDSGCAMGGWYYSAFDGSGSCGYMDASTAQWGYIGLETAEIVGKKFGVIVSNRHKYRTAYAAARNTASNGGAQYRTSGSYPNNLMLTGGNLLVARWLEFDKLPNQGNAKNQTPFAPYDTSYRVRDYQDKIARIRSFVSSYWSNTGCGPHCDQRFWSTGNYYCNNYNGVYLGASGSCGNLYSIYSNQKGFRTGSPVEPNPRVVNGFGWSEQFSIYAMRSQYRTRGDFNNGNWGYIEDCSAGGNIACHYGGASFMTAVGVLILTPTLFNPKPVAIASVSPSPAIVFEGGCVQAPRA